MWIFEVLRNSILWNVFICLALVPALYCQRRLWGSGSVKNNPEPPHWFIWYVIRVFTQYSLGVHWISSLYPVTDWIPDFYLPDIWPGRIPDIQTDICLIHFSYHVRIICLCFHGSMSDSISGIWPAIRYPAKLNAGYLAGWISSAPLVCVNHLHSLYFTK